MLLIIWILIIILIIFIYYKVEFDTTDIGDIIMWYGPIEKRKGYNLTKWYKI